MANLLEKFFAKYILPELLTRSLDPTCIQSSTDQAENNTNVYCICKREAFRPMVACDALGCTGEWFHYECVGLIEDTDPDSEWYCDALRSKFNV